MEQQVERPPQTDALVEQIKAELAQLALRQAFLQEMLGQYE